MFIFVCLIAFGQHWIAADGAFLDSEIARTARNSSTDIIFSWRHTSSPEAHDGSDDRLLIPAILTLIACTLAIIIAVIAFIYRTIKYRQQASLRKFLHESTYLRWEEHSSYTAR